MHRIELVNATIKSLLGQKWHDVTTVIQKHDSGVIRARAYGVVIRGNEHIFNLIEYDEDSVVLLHNAKSVTGDRSLLQELINDAS